MIHELDLLDISSYFIKPNKKCILTISELINIKKILENNFNSVSIEIQDKDIYTFVKYFSDCAKYKDNKIILNFDAKTYQEILKLRTPYLEKEIIQFLNKNITKIFG